MMNKKKQKKKKVWKLGEPLTDGLKNKLKENTVARKR